MRLLRRTVYIPILKVDSGNGQWEKVRSGEIITILEIPISENFVAI